MVISLNHINLRERLAPGVSGFGPYMPAVLKGQAVQAVQSREGTDLNVSSPNSVAKAMLHYKCSSDVSYALQSVYQRCLLFISQATESF